MPEAPRVSLCRSIDTAPRDGREIAYLAPIEGDHPEVPLWTLGRARWLTAAQCVEHFGGSLDEYVDGWSDDAGDDPLPTYWLPAECLPEEARQCE